MIITHEWNIKIYRWLKMFTFHSKGTAWLYEEHGNSFLLACRVAEAHPHHRTGQLIPLEPWLSNPTRTALGQQSGMTWSQWRAVGTWSCMTRSSVPGHLWLKTGMSRRAAWTQLFPCDTALCSNSLEESTDPPCSRESSVHRELPPCTFPTSA